MEKSERGFTLVELAIVLVIIGIILGGILKGKALIDNARTKRVEKDMRGIEAAMWTFYDRYGRFPGDCDKNGIVDAKMSNPPYYTAGTPGFCSDSGFDSGVPNAPWEELRKAEIFSINEDNRDLTRTIFNGFFEIGNVMEDGDPTNSTYNGIGVFNIPCFAAKAIDQSIDGSVNGTSGAIRILVDADHFANGTDADYDNDTVCKTEDTPINIVYLFDKTP